jgi:GDP-4-dehydro-6-deoxy-D-mannose reductase
MSGSMTSNGPVLVTGAAGFAGSHLVDHLVADGLRVAAWAGPSGRGVPARPDVHVTWAAVDVTDREAVARHLADLRPSAVYHCAGIADVQSAWSDAATALRVNALGTHVLLSELQRAGLRAPVLVTSSALVYRQAAGPLSEDAPLGPATPYGVSKLAQEMLAAAAGGDVVVVARPFNHAGPRQSDSFATSSFARQIAEAECGTRGAVLRVGNLDARRDVTDVRDTVRAYRLLIDRGRRGVPYNVCRGEAFRVGELLERLVAAARVPIRVEVDPARLRPSETPLVLGNPGRLRADTGWEAQVPIERTLTDLLDYWRGVVGDRGQSRA